MSDSFLSRALKDPNGIRWTRGKKERFLQEAKALMEKLPEYEGCYECAMFDISSGYCSRWQSVVPGDNVPEGCANKISVDSIEDY